MRSEQFKMGYLKIICNFYFSGVIVVNYKYVINFIKIQYSSRSSVVK